MADGPDEAGLGLEANLGRLVKSLHEVKALDHHIGAVDGVVEIRVKATRGGGEEVGLPVPDGGIV